MASNDPAVPDIPGIATVAPKPSNATAGLMAAVGADEATRARLLAAVTSDVLAQFSGLAGLAGTLGGASSRVGTRNGAGDLGGHNTPSEPTATASTASSASSTIGAEEALAAAVYHERQRLALEAPGAQRRADLAFWAQARGVLGKGSEAERQRLLEAAIGRYAEEICGRFDARTYQVATRVLPPVFGAVLNGGSPAKLWLAARRALAKSRDRMGPQLASRSADPQSLGAAAPTPFMPAAVSTDTSANASSLSLDRAILLQGETEQLRRLHARGGAVIMVPTHVSNLDSLVLGYGIHQLGLPPFTYGAGLNLFSHPLVGFFLRRLGAYTVDRKKQDPLYKATLKAYATHITAQGQPSLFFPGGTRSRSGAVERHLKLGLLGTSVAAYVHRLRAQLPHPNVYIVPATLSFQLVLEAETLVDDFLKEVGKARYIISDDEFAQPRRLWDFVRQLFALDSKIYFTVGRAIDPFGNRVDDDGVSHDPCGRPIAIDRYVRDRVTGEPLANAQRDAEFTREVGVRITESFMGNNVIQSTHLVAWVLLCMLRQLQPRVPLLRLLRVSGETPVRLPQSAVLVALDRTVAALRQLATAGKIRLGGVVAEGRLQAVLADALRHYQCYHQRAACERRGDVLHITDRSLLFYYHNRLVGYGLESLFGLTPALRRDHRSLNSQASFAASASATANASAAPLGPRGPGAALDSFAAPSASPAPATPSSAPFAAAA